MPYGPTPSIIDEAQRKEEIELKKKEMSFLSNHELSDLLRQHFEREVILATEVAAFDKTFRGKLTTGLLFAFPSTLLISGMLESLIHPKAEDAGKYTVYAGLAVYVSLMMVGWNLPSDPKLDSWEARIRKDAMMELYAERYGVKPEYVKSRLSNSQ